jgi:hypothetical protein
MSAEASMPREDRRVWIVLKWEGVVGRVIRHGRSLDEMNAAVARNYPNEAVSVIEFSNNAEPPTVIALAQVFSRQPIAAE